MSSIPYPYNPYKEEVIRKLAHENKCEEYLAQYGTCLDRNIDKKHIPLEVCSIYHEAFNRCDKLKS